MVTIAAASTNINPVEAVIVCITILLVGVAFAWDGLIRRKVSLPSSPFGGGYFGVKESWAVIIGLASLLIDLFMLFSAFFYMLEALEVCRNAPACISETIRGVEWPAWACLGGVMIWFLLVWLRTGNLYKRVLVYGIWYRQDKVARLVQHELQNRGLKPLPTERIYALEFTLVHFMQAQHWLVNGKTWLDGGNYTPKEIPTAEMLGVVLSQPAFQQSSKAQRAAIEFLLDYFKAEAQRAQRMSLFHRWLVGTAQIGKRQVYGRRAI